MSAAVAVSRQGIYFPILDNRLTMTRIALEPTLSGRPVMKTMEMEFQWRSGISRGLSLPKGACFVALDLKQVLPLSRNGQGTS